MRGTIERGADLRPELTGAADSMGGGPWPTPAQELLLRAALLGDSRGLAAWQRWKATHDLFGSDVDHGAVRLLPLVYKNLRGLGADEPAMRTLGGVYRYWWCSNQNLLHRAAPLLEGLHAEGVRTMVLDGAAAAVLYYRDSGVRPIDVIHVMIPVEQIGRAVPILRRWGWRAASGRIAEDTRYRHSTRMIGESDQELELHWYALRERPDVNIDRGFWRRSVPLAIHGAVTGGLAPGDALLHAVMHGMRGGARQTLGWIADAMAILKATEGRLDWEALAEEARARRVELHLSRGLDYLEGAFDVRVPGSVRARLRSATPSRVQRLELRYLTRRSGRRRRLARIAALALEYLRVVEGRSGRAKLSELPGFLRYRLRGRAGRMIDGAGRVAQWTGPASPSRGTRRAPGLPG